MHAKDIYEVLDQSGLTPAVHYHAAPFEWRNAMQDVALLFGAEADEISDLKRTIRELEGDLHDAWDESSALRSKLKELQK